MGGGGSVNIAHIFTHENRYDPPPRRVLTRVSTFVFGEAALPDAAELPHVNESMVTGAPTGPTLPSPTGNIGILLERSQSVDDFVLLFEGQRYLVHLASPVERELADTFGEPPGLKWHGYTVALPPPTDRFRMSALLKLIVNFHRHPTTGTFNGIYAAPMVFGFHGVPFARHYALGLTTLQPDATNLVDTSARVRL